MLITTALHCRKQAEESSPLV